MSATLTTTETPTTASKPLSKKARQRAKTQFKLHDVIKADSTGLGKAVATGHRVRAGKGKVWDAEAVPPPEVTALKQQCQALSLAGSVPDSGDAVFPLTSNQSVMLEQLRAAKYHQLRKTLTTLSTAVAPLQPPIFAIERWQARCRLRETLHPEVIAQGVRDPLLPSAQYSDPGLVQDFSRASYTEDQATRIATALSRASHTATVALVQRSTELSHTVSKYNSQQKKKVPLSIKGAGEATAGREPPPVTVQVVKHKHSIDFLMAPPKQTPSRKRRRGQASSAEEQEGEGGSGKRGAGKLYKLNHVHYQKLRDLFLQNRSSSDMTNISGASRGGSDSDRGGESRRVEPQADWSAQDEEEFHERVYVLLSRYHSLLGHGFQAALNEHSFQVLKQHFGVCFECFASPLNATFGHFCSAFADTDRFFGSYGSFFSFRPTSGSFEANPPFIAEIMAAMVEHIHALLEAATGPMSFVIIVPGWREDAAWQALEGSPWRQALFLVAEPDHGFCDGAQHQRQDRYRESPYDSGVFILQNNSGAAKWPASERVEAELRLAMAHAVPTPQMVQRRLREGRGLADQDGGGGVYRGKKSNRKQRGCAPEPPSSTSIGSKQRKKKR